MSRSESSDDGDLVLRNPATDPRWLRILGLVFLVVMLVRLGVALWGYATTGEGLGQVLWRVAWVAVALLFEWSTRANPMEARITDDVLITPRPVVPRRTPWSEVAQIRTRGEGRWAVAWVAELRSGKELPLYGDEVGGTGLQEPEVLRFVEAARARVAAAGGATQG